MEAGFALDRADLLALAARMASHPLASSQSYHLDHERNGAQMATLCAENDQDDKEAVDKEGDHRAAAHAAHLPPAGPHDDGPS